MQRIFIIALIMVIMLAGCVTPAPVVISLIEPANGSMVGSVTPTLSWRGGTENTIYRLIIAGDSNLQNVVLDAANLNLVNYTVPSGKLNINSQYYWKVQASQGGRAMDWTVARSFKTPGANPVSTGGIRVSATLDGVPWNGAVNFRISGPHTDSENTVPWSFNSIPAGSYSITYNFGGPQGATLTDITPAPALQLSGGSMGYFTLNFHTTSSSRIKVSATLNGAEWSGNINYSVYGPFKDIDTYAPHTFISVPAGSYTVTYNSGGPQGAVLNGVSPSASQTLTTGGEIEFKLNFVTSKSSTLSVTALNNGSPWAGSIRYSITGPIAGSYSSVPIVFSDVPAGTYTITYQSGGPAGSTMGGVTPSTTLIIVGGRAAEFTFNFHTQVSTSSVVINATLNGASWSGPVSYAINGPMQSTDYVVPRSYSPAPTGYYTLSYLGGGPDGATLSSITPAPAQTLAAGKTITFSLNFSSQSQTGTIIVSATLDGRPWATNPGSGPISYSVIKPSLANTESTVPITLRDYPSGPYTLIYNSGGPIGATLSGISPSPNQYLSAGGTIAFTMDFTSESRGYVTVDATLDGHPWSGPASYVVLGPYVESGDSVSMTFSNVPRGTYKVEFQSGGPDIGHFTGVYPSSQQLLPGGAISFTLKFANTLPRPGPIPVPTPTPTPGPMPGPVPNPTPEPMPGPVPNPTPEPMPGPVPNPRPMPEPMPGPVNTTDEDTLKTN